MHIKNTSAAKTPGYTFAHIKKPRTENPASCTAQKRTMAIKCKSKAVQNTNVLSIQSRQNCSLCGSPTVHQLLVAAEAAFYHRFHVSQSQIFAYKSLLNACACSVDVFQPFHEIVKHQKSIRKTSSCSVRLVEMNKNKKADKDAVGAPEKLSVPFLCMDDVPRGILAVLLESDRERTYFSHPWQKYDEWEVLYAGDMGAQSTKFFFFNTSQVKFNTGQILVSNICGRKLQILLRTAKLHSAKMFHLELKKQTKVVC